MNRKCFQWTRNLINSINLINNSVFLGVNYETHVIRRWAGHSKWQNIKSTKQAADRLKCLVFSKLARQIERAVKENGENMSTNPKLKALWEESRKCNMPKARFENCVKAAKTSGSEKPFWTVFSGPKGVVLGLEVSFLNKSQGFLQAKLAPQFKKLKMKMEPHYDDLCVEKGIIITNPLPEVEKGYDKAVDDAIEIGADEVLEEDNTLIFECLPERVDSIQQKLESKGYEVLSASTELEFKEFISLSEEEEKNLETVINRCKDLNSEVIRASYNVINT